MSDDRTFLKPDSFAGKTALVTGGGTGLGLEVSTRMGRMGANIICVSRDTKHHDELLARGARDGFQVWNAAMDVREPHEVKRVVREGAKHFDGIDVLVNNAAGNFLCPAMALPPRGFKAVVDIGLNGVFYVSREVGRLMRKTGGSIVNISAPYAATGKPGVVHSACAKAGVDALTRTLAAEWAPMGIRVNAVSPGPFFSEGAADRLWPSEEMEAAVLDQIPLGRFGKAEEVADLVCLLAGPDTPWITGSILVADGGWSLPSPLGEIGDKRVPRRKRDGTSSPAPKARGHETS